MKKILITLIIFGLFFSLIPINIGIAEDDPLLSDILGYWCLDCDSGTIAIDLTPNQNNGSLINMEDTDWVSGKLDNCLQFNGIDEYVDLGNIAEFEKDESFSFEFWFKTTTTSLEMIISKMLMPITRGYFVGLQDGKLNFGIYTASSGHYAQIRTVNLFNDGIFYHLVATYDGSSLANGMKIYVDNQNQATTIEGNNLDDTIINTGNVIIGGRNDATYFNGLIDEVVIYNKELSPLEVEYRYNDGNGRPYNHPPIKPICIQPVDKTMNINIDTTLKTKVIDIDNDTMNVSFYLGDIFVETFFDVSNNTILESSNLSLEYSKMYNWYVTAEDKRHSTQSDIFIFATESEPEPIIPNIPPEKPILISPDNNSINISKFTRLKSHVDDIDDDFLSVSFYWENNTEIQTMLSITNYTIQTYLLNLSYNTTYSWYVITTDFIDFNVSDTYTLTTEIEVIVEDDITPPTPLEIDYSILLIGICLAVIVFILEFLSNKLKIKRTNLLSAIELSLIIIIISIMIFLKFN